MKDGFTGTYIEFESMPTHGLRTKKWGVVAKAHGECLGFVRWLARWRRYVFYPASEYPTIFEETCLREIAQFIEERTNEHKKVRQIIRYHADA